MIKNKKSQELNYIIFIGVFVVIFGIISSMFLKNVLNGKSQENESWFSVIFDLLNNALTDVPIIGSFWDVITASYNFIYIHPYLALVYGALFGIPLGYIIIRLFKGGG